MAEPLADRVIQRIGQVLPDSLNQDFIIALE